MIIIAPEFLKLIFVGEFLTIFQLEGDGVTFAGQNFTFVFHS